MQDLASSHSHIRASQVRGTNVFNIEGEHLGHIDDIVLSKVEGKAAYAIMSFGGFLGMGERYHPLPWRSLNYDPARDGYVVNVSREQLESAATYGRDEGPDWNDPSYGGELSRHYGFPYA